MVDVEWVASRHLLVLVLQPLLTDGVGALLAAAAAVGIGAGEPMFGRYAPLARLAGCHDRIRLPSEPESTGVTSGSYCFGRALSSGCRLVRASLRFLAGIGTEPVFWAALGAREPVTAQPTVPGFQPLAPLRCSAACTRTVCFARLACALAACGCFEGCSAAATLAKFDDRRLHLSLTKTLIRAVASSAALAKAERLFADLAWTQVGHPWPWMCRARSCPFGPQTVLAIASKKFSRVLAAAKISDRPLCSAANADLGHLPSLGMI